MLAAVVAILTFQAHAQEPIKLRIATFLPPTSFFVTKTITPWVEAVERDAGGTVKFEIFAGGTLGAAGRNPAMQLKLVTDGIADLTFVIPVYVAGRFPEDGLFNLPFIAANSYEASVAAWRLLEKGLLRGYDDPAFKVVALYVNPPNVLNTDFPVTRMEELAGKKIQTGGPEQQDIVRALGGVPVGNVSTREVAEAISRGVVNGTLKDWLAVYSFRLDAVTKHHVDLPLGSSSILLPFNRAKYNSLPEKARAAIDKHSGLELVRRVGREFDAAAKAAFDRAKADPGRTIVTLAPSELERWKAATESVADGFRKESESNEKLYQAYVREVSEARAGR
jgi:TRAP-type C4-dicarboxylate transport system substrate-binding protein